MCVEYESICIKQIMHIHTFICVHAFRISSLWREAWIQSCYLFFTFCFICTSIVLNFFYCVLGVDFFLLKKNQGDFLVVQW